MKISSAVLAALLLTGAFAHAVYSQVPPGQPYIQIPIPMPVMPQAVPPRPERREYDRGWWEHCEHLRHREHEIRKRLAYAPPYSEERERLEHRLREVDSERERCRGW